MPPRRHIAIEGVIAAGKSTLAQALASELAAPLLLEQAEANPFLERFYDDAPRWALATQLHFLAQRVRQVQAALQALDVPASGPAGGAPPLVSDFMFAKNEVFAELTLSGDELALYRALHAPLAAGIPEPDLVIWLEAGAPVLTRRIAQRGRPMEQGIEPAYLEGLAAGYRRWFEARPRLPVLVLDAEAVHPAEQPGQMRRLIERIGAMRGARDKFP